MVSSTTIMDSARGVGTLLCLGHLGTLEDAKLVAVVDAILYPVQQPGDGAHRSDLVLCHGDSREEFRGHQTEGTTSYPLTQTWMERTHTCADAPSRS